ncbi:hypothetical protein QVD17_08700 [Tagetes erecta]|uniref:Uncharacterized protein n=1 Tax=Tagetes erecta TaxID=13708 RepID=A0AAD8KZQ4_TARER|nr:hypothetical protein QVD17_08700 [Tagetes erecta]
MTNLALLAEVVEEDWPGRNDPKSTDVEEEDDEYDWSDKSDPIPEIEAEEMKHGHDNNLLVKGNKDEEVALMAQSEQIKVESSSSKSEKPSNCVPLRETVKAKLSSPECILQDSWKKSLGEIESLKHQLSELSKNFKNEKIAHALTQVELTKKENCNTNDHSPENEARLKEFLRKKSDDEHQEEESEVEVFIETDQAKTQNGHPVKIKSYHPRNRTKQVYVAKGCQEIFEECSNKEERPKSDKSSNDHSSSDYGFKNPEFVKWQNDERKKQIVGDCQRQ